jgi:trehalose 6-phosphate synthase/phosphatase
MRYDVSRWATDFLGKLDEVMMHQLAFDEYVLTAEARERLLAAFHAARKRLLLLDYDGTLVPFAQRPEGAAPDAEIVGVLRALAADERNTVVLVSGRERGSLEEWLGSVGASLVAEHGAWVRERGGEWTMTEPLDDAWKAQVRPIMDLYVDRTPGSFVEEKDFSLAWHYRRTDPSLAEVRSRELQDSLTHLTANQNLGVLAGNKVLEIKSVSIDKGRGAQPWLERGGWDFILAIGDDRTDEDMFGALPDWATSIKVGLGPSRAKFSLDSVADVRGLLRELVSADA